MNLLSHNSYLAFRDHEVLLAKKWKTPLNLAIALHILVFTTATLAPGIFKSRNILPEVYTVNLLDVTEIQSQPAPQKPAVQKKVITPKAETPATKAPAKPEEKLAVKTEVSKTLTAPLLPGEAISLQPLKQKVMKTTPAETNYKKKLAETRRTKELERVRAEQEFAKAQKRADMEAQSALAKLRQSLLANNAAQTAKEEAAQPQENTTSSAGTAVELDTIMRHYYPAIQKHIHDHWILPDLQDWDESLSAVLVINVRNDGVVTKTFFEKKSDNIFFNQFVMKTVRDAAPLPPFPPELKKSSIEIGLVFSPGGLM